MVRLNFKFATGAGYFFELLRVVCCIVENVLPTELGQILLGKEVLRRLCYDPRQMLHDTRLSMTDLAFDRVESEGEL